MDQADADTEPVPALVRSRLALVALFVVFLIPVTQSTLRGLTHVLSCTERVDTPFQVVLLEDDEPIVTGSSVITADEDPTLCGGLAVQIGAGPSETGDIDVIVSVTNESPNDWYGTVEIDVMGVRVPVDIGRIDAGETAEGRIALSLPDGVTEFGGSLLVGP